LLDPWPSNFCLTNIFLLEVLVHIDFVASLFQWQLKATLNLLPLMASGCSPSFKHLIGKQIKQVQGPSMLKRVYDCDDDFENLPPHDFENELHEF
jgi:hypothetical protein